MQKPTDDPAAVFALAWQKFVEKRGPLPSPQLGAAANRKIMMNRLYARLDRNK